MSQEFEPNMMPYEHTLSVESDLNRAAAKAMLEEAGFRVRGSEVHLPDGTLKGLLLPTGMIQPVSNEEIVRRSKAPVGLLFQLEGGEQYEGK